MNTTPYETRRWVFWVMGILLLGVVSPVSAQNDGLTDVGSVAQPIVMILLDTSGSMEFVTADSESGSTTGVFPVCFDSTDPNSGDPLDQEWDRPRHVIAKEVLTGRFEDYYCEEVSRSLPPVFDDGYPVPHFEPRFSRRLEDTGLIFLNRELVRFGFMSFDSDRSGSPGDPFNFPLEGSGGESLIWNLGARGPDATDSPLIAVGDLKNRTAGRRTAEQIQASIANFIPFNSTPLAALFHDLDFYLKTDDDIVNDEFQACRRREVILITDGQPSFDECTPGGDDEGKDFCRDYPYKTTLQEISDVVAEENVAVHVIGFNLSEEDSKPCTGGETLGDGVNGDNVACIHQMAYVGNTDSNEDAPGGSEDNVFAYVANNQLELTRDLTRILNQALIGTTARTRTSTTGRTNFRDVSGGTYQFGAAFDVDVTSHLWRGRLERTERRCAGGALLDPVTIDYGELLNEKDPASRVIYTPLLDPDNEEAAPQDAYLTQNGSELINFAQQRTTLRTVIADDDLDDAFNTGVLPGTDIAEIQALARGERDRAGRVLGGIFHSNPVIVGGPELSLNIPGYQTFANAVNPVDDPRRTMVYVGANDGTLHAFNAEYDPADDPVDELWAFLPQELQQRLYLQKATRINGVDGSPLVGDVRLFRGANKPADVVDPVGDSVQDTSQFFDIWDTVLIAGLRTGGRSYFSLSVADPEEPRFLWELNPETERRTLAFSSDKVTTVSVDLTPSEPLIGLAVGEPAMGTVLMTDDDDVRFERGIAILPGGQPASQGNPGDVGKVIFVVDLATGEVLRRFTTYNNNDSTPIEFPVTGSVAAHDNFPGKILTRAFVGDAGGRLLRIDLRSDKPENWSVDVFHDAFEDSDDDARQPIFLRPAVATNRAGQLVILYGSGDIDDLENRREDNALFSLTEVINFDDGFFVESFKAEVNWKLTFEGSEKLTGSPIIFNSVAYFPTFVPNNTPCENGNGRIYAVDFNQANDGGNVIGKLDGGDDQFDDENLGLTLNNDNVFFDLAAGSVVFGLEIAPVPFCSPDIPENINDFDINSNQVQQNSDPNQLQLVAQTGGNDTGRLGDVNSRINTLRFNLNRPPSAVFPRSWSVLLD